MHQANARGFRRVNHIALQHHARGIAAAHAAHHPGQDLRWHQAALGLRRGEARISGRNRDISRAKPAKPASMGRALHRRNHHLRQVAKPHKALPRGMVALLRGGKPFGLGPLRTNFGQIKPRAEMPASA